MYKFYFTLYFGCSFFLGRGCLQGYDGATHSCIIDLQLDKERYSTELSQEQSSRGTKVRQGAPVYLFNNRFLCYQVWRLHRNHFTSRTWWFVRKSKSQMENVLWAVILSAFGLKWWMLVNLQHKQYPSLWKLYDFVQRALKHLQVHFNTSFSSLVFLDVFASIGPVVSQLCFKYGTTSIESQDRVLRSTF